MGGRKSFIFTFVFVLFNVGFVRGYIDPGTGGMIIGNLWSWISAVAGAVVSFLIIYFFKPLKKKIKKVFGKNEN